MGSSDRDRNLLCRNLKRRRRDRGVPLPQVWLRDQPDGRVAALPDVPAAKLAAGAAPACAHPQAQSVNRYQGASALLLRSVDYLSEYRMRVVPPLPVP